VPRIILLSLLTLCVLVIVSTFDLPTHSRMAESFSTISPLPPQNIGSIPPCTPNTDVHVKYLGKQTGKDVVEVDWNINAGASSQGNFQGNQSLRAEVVCALNPGFLSSFVVDVKITRQFGHEDSGRTNTGGGFGFGNFSANVEIPRGALETNPSFYDVTVDGSVQGFITRQARLTGTGTLSLDNGSQTTTTIAAQSTISEDCAPSLTITGLTLRAAKLPGQKDSLIVSWTTPPNVPFGGAAVPKSNCFKYSGAQANVKLTRTDGTTVTGSGSAGPTSSQATVPLSGSAGDVSSFEIKVVATFPSKIPVQLHTNGFF
jgi:hypothetical protein